MINMPCMRLFTVLYKTSLHGTKPIGKQVTAWYYFLHDIGDDCSIRKTKSGYFQSSCPCSCRCWQVLRVF